MAHHPGCRGTCWSRAAEPLAKHLYAQHLSRLPCSVTLPEWWMVRPTLQPPSFTCVILTMTVVRFIFPSPFICLLSRHCLSCCDKATKVDAMAHHPGYRGCWGRAAEPLAKHLYAQHLSLTTLQPPSFTCVILTMTVVRFVFPSPFIFLLSHPCQFML